MQRQEVGSHFGYSWQDFRLPRLADWTYGTSAVDCSFNPKGGATITDSLQIALSLANLSIAVFPVDPETKRPFYKAGVIEHGHLEATFEDHERIATWFSLDFPGAFVGVHVGKSGLVVADPDRKNGVNGFDALDGEWLSLPPTWHYDTPNNGQHWIYAAPEGVHLAQSPNYRGMPGFDRKGGSSYIVWWSDQVPDSRDVFTAAPKWLCDPAEPRAGSSFNGELDEWLGTLEDGEPTAKVLEAMGRVPLDEDFGHTTMVELAWNLVRLHAEGHTGVGTALEHLRSEWLRPPYNTDDYAYELDQAIAGAIKKAGALDDEISALMPYVQAVDSLPDDFDIEILLGQPMPKAHWFRVVRSLATCDESVALSVAWNAPSIKAWSREFGLEYLKAQLADARAKASEPVPVNPEMKATERGVSLLTDDERGYLDRFPTFMGRYCAYAADRTSRFNGPYHRMNAWTILSLGFSFHGFLREPEGVMGLNLFLIAGGLSGTGKSRSIKLREAVTRELFSDDPDFDIGGNASLEALQDTLLTRDRRASFFNTDEAARFFAQIAKDGSYLAGLPEYIADLYEGVVKSMLRRGRKRDENAMRAIISFVMAMYGTPDRMFGLMTEEMFGTGFIPRIMFFIGDPPLDDDSQFEVAEPEHEIALAEDFGAEMLASEIRAVRRKTAPILTSREAKRVLSRAMREAQSYLKRNSDWNLTQPSWNRMMSEAVRKCAALLALADGQKVTQYHHMLAALSQAEEWLQNLVHVSHEISASAFQREADEIERFLIARGGSAPASVVANRFKKWEPRDFAARVESLRLQGRVKVSDREYSINEKVVE